MTEKPQYINYCIDIIDNQFIDKFRVQDSELPAEQEYLLNLSLTDEVNE